MFFNRLLIKKTFLFCVQRTFHFVEISKEVLCIIDLILLLLSYFYLSKAAKSVLLLLLEYFFTQASILLLKYQMWVHSNNHCENEPQSQLDGSAQNDPTGGLRWFFIRPSCQTAQSHQDNDTRLLKWRLFIGSHSWCRVLSTSLPETEDRSRNVIKVEIRYLRRWLLPPAEGAAVQRLSDSSVMKLNITQLFFFNLLLNR